MAQARDIRERRPWQVLTGFGVKLVAILTMLVDHAAIILVWPIYQTTLQFWGAADAQAWAQLYDVMRIVGRVAFPLFCFLLAEGFAHTHSRPKYAWRLFLFALISEWPFDFALYDSPLEFREHQNVMFTLLIAFLTLWAADVLGRRIDGALARRRGTQPPSARSLTPAKVACTVALALVGGAVGNAFEVDYHAFGVLLVCALYLGRERPWVRLGLGCALVAWYCVAHGSALEAWSLIGLGVTLLYNGQRGRSMRWFFYVFYPAHLLVLAGIAAVM